MEGDKSEEGLPIEALTFNQVQSAARLGIMALWPLDALLYRVYFPIRPPRTPHSSQLVGRSPLWWPNPCNDVTASHLFFFWRRSHVGIREQAHENDQVMRLDGLPGDRFF